MTLLRMMTVPLQMQLLAEEETKLLLRRERGRPLASIAGRQAVEVTDESRTRMTSVRLVSGATDEATNEKRVKRFVLNATGDLRGVLVVRELLQR